MDLTVGTVFECLKSVIDPELGINIVDLGLIYHVTVQDGRVEITMTLTSPGCPLAGTINQLIKDSLTQISNLNVDSQVAINLTFDPPWVEEMMTKEAKAELDFYLN